MALTGSLTIAWVGDPAGGCAAVGVCAVRGSVVMLLGNGSESASSGPAPLDVSDENAVARVQTTAPDGTVTACADLVPVDFTLAVRRIGGAPRATINVPESIGLPSAGRCAGPTGADLRGLALPARRFGAHGYDMTGQSSFRGGPFTVSAFSTVRAHITYGPQHGGPFGVGPGVGGVIGSTRPLKRRSALEESATVVYRVTGLAGALNTDFAGLAPPLCDGLGACGTSGRLVQTFAMGGTLSFSGTRLVRRRIRAQGALADLRRGRLQLFDTFGSSPLRTTVDETLARSDGSHCSDHAVTDFSAGTDRARRASDELRLSANPGEFPGGGIDPFRTRCPGPSAADILGPGNQPLGAATVSAAQLGDPRLSIVFRNRGSFDGTAYAGERGGAVVLSLSLVRSRGVTRRVTVFQGIPVFPVS
ncbi:MAG: hypothetical protein ACXVSE_08970 [Solirubrobacteraceae bacterium]